MRRLTLSLAACLALGAASASAQHYDPFYVLPAEAGRLGATAVLACSDMARLADASHLPLAAKYSLGDDLEVGVRVGVGALDESASSLSTVEVGAKLGLAPNTAVTGALLAPLGDADEVGLSIGLMHTLSTRDLRINNWIQAGLLDGYTGGRGVDLALLVEPARELGDRLTAYVDVLVGTNTDDLGDHLRIDLGPNVDYMFSERTAVNAGLTLGVAGDMKQDDLGVSVAVLISY